MTRQAHDCMKYILLILALAVRVAAASITHTAATFPQITNWSLTNSVPQFDPALGTLTNVTITVAVNASTQLRVENRDTTPWLTYAASEVTATGTVAGYSASTTLTNSHTATLSEYDGVLDYSGTSGFNVAVVGADSGFAVPSDFTPFIGTGTVPLIAAATAVGVYEGSGNYRFIVTTRASTIVTVTYEFSLPPCPECPPACDPEPVCEPEPKDCYSGFWKRSRRDR